MRAEAVINRAATFATVFAAAFVFLAATMATADAEDLRVGLDQAVPMRLAAPAEGVAVGNPSIAGVSVQNDQLLFITGRSYGSTNLVVVGGGGRVLYSGRITVVPDEANVVMVTRGTNTQRLECTPQCRPRPDIGDSADAFSAVVGQIAGHASAAGGN